MTSLSTHVLDSVTGTPVTGMRVVLDELDGAWSTVGTGVTDTDGRLRDWGPSGSLRLGGDYRLTFDTGRWFESQQVVAFYPEVAISFRIDDDRHYHVPLLLAPYAYSTYRGS